jgi:PAS domain-containing protein
VATTERDVTRRNQRQAELRASEINYRALVDSAPDALVIVIEAGAIKVDNTQAERMFWLY